jgi:hypothetical protein
MSDGVAFCLVLMLALIYGKICGVRDQLKRIADFCERSESRLTGRNR